MSKEVEEIFSSINKPESAKIVTLADLLESYYRWREDNIDVPIRLEMSSELYEHINEEAKPEHVTGKKRQKLKLQEFYGMKIKIDPTLAAGEWKLVSKSREPLYFINREVEEQPK